MREGFQLSADGDWLADYPDPSSYLPQFFGCGGGTSNGYFCDPALDRAMRQAGQLGLTDPARSAAAWAAVDRDLTAAAAWAPTVSLRDVELTSPAIGELPVQPGLGLPRGPELGPLAMRAYSRQARTAWTRSPAWLSFRSCRMWLTT